MATTQRLVEHGIRRARSAFATLAEEFRDKRIALGLSQRRVAEAAGISRATYTRIENGKFETLSIIVASRIASALGLDLSVRVYPGANPLRDAAQARRLGLVLAEVGSPLSSRTEVALPQIAGHPFEQRAWDADLSGVGRRTTMEMEMSVRDAQALERRINLKRRDDPSESFVLLVADTHRNRRTFREHTNLFPDLMRISRHWSDSSALASTRRTRSCLCRRRASGRIRRAAGGSVARQRQGERRAAAWRFRVGDRATVGDGHGCGD